MLAYLRVENLAVVEKAELNFTSKLNILTGETGAGKSILIDAILLLTNKKFSTGLIRRGADRLRVEALFVEGDQEFTLKRELEGSKSLAFINGQLVTFNQLRDKASALLNVYGQKEHAFLLSSANHLAYLDEFSHHEELLTRLTGKYKAAKKLQREWQDLAEKNKQASEKIDYLNFQLQALDSLNLKKGDETLLRERRKLLSSAEEISAKANGLLQDLYQKEQSVYNILAQNQAPADYLRSLFEDFAPFKDEIDRFYNLVPEISAYLSGLIGRSEYNEDELNTIEEKLDKVEKLKAKFKLQLDQILDKYEEWKAERDQLANLNFYLSDKQKEIAAVLQEYREINNRLRESRKKNAARLGQLVVRELAQLEMKKAIFESRFNEAEPEIENITESGTDRMEFYFSSNPGQPAGRLAEVASGGELSRLMLVLKSLGKEEKDATYIFDEIDAGIGGKTAEFVGEKLRQISEANQVICISHLPQIASFAERHFLISKEFRNNQTFSSARVLKASERTHEIARLMAGSAINEVVLKAADSLLEKNRG